MAEWDWPRTWMLVGAIAGAIAVAASVASAWLSIQDADASKLEIAELNKSAKDAAARIADANRDAELARLEQERIKAQVSWRDLTEKDRATFLQALGPEPGEVLIAWQVGDVEATRYAGTIALALQGSGWKVSTEARVYARSFLTGIQLSDRGAHPERERLLAAFAAIHIPAGVRTIPQHESAIAYVVGDPQAVLVGSSPILLNSQ